MWSFTEEMKNLHSDLQTFDPQNWRDKLCDPELVTKWAHSCCKQSDKIVCGVGSAHNKVTYFMGILHHLMIFTILLIDHVIYRIGIYSKGEKKKKNKRPIIIGHLWFASFTSRIQNTSILNHEMTCSSFMFLVWICLCVHVIHLIKLLNNTMLHRGRHAHEFHEKILFYAWAKW
jgi:hypothetical protein